MPVTQDFIDLATSLVDRGYSYASQYANGLSPPQSFYIILKYQDSVVAVLPVSDFKYYEYSATQQRLVYTAVDSSDSTYTFDEVMLVAGNMYVVTDDYLTQPVQREGGIPLTVTVTLEVTVTTNSVTEEFYFTFPGSAVPVKMTLCQAVTQCLFGSPSPQSPLPMPDFLVLMLLIPTSFYSSLSSTKFYQTYQQYNVVLSEVAGIRRAGIAGIVLISPNTFQVVDCTMVSTFTPFKASAWMSKSIVTAFEDLTGLLVPVASIFSSMSSTEFYEVVMTTVATTQ